MRVNDVFILWTCVCFAMSQSLSRTHLVIHLGAWCSAKQPPSMISSVEILSPDLTFSLKALWKTAEYVNSIHNILMMEMCGPAPQPVYFC